MYGAALRLAFICICFVCYIRCRITETAIFVNISNPWRGQLFMDTSMSLAAMFWSC